MPHYKARMGWMILWYSSFGSAFNEDVGATTLVGEDIAIIN
ncbi:DUF899 family protein [Halomonas alkaliantarctica]|uniref:DUF899 family protein n=1 Tax=Halomonas alkaliantarctica TaxID=232346 RepID=A0ABY8LSC9_9GAMM|nr:DUF899 family protein [Halomonas alkaliantarctica]WGI27330.1 DUF899 family protein [Halomonas alkaliantarctica]